MREGWTGRYDGSPMGNPRPLTDRFWEKVDKRGPDECWEWTAGRATSTLWTKGKPKFDYGIFHRGSEDEYQAVQAHRMSWELHNGSIPDSLFVCHTCDNPPCVNPGHLFLGTHLDNMRDRKAKGRY